MASLKVFLGQEAYYPGNILEGVVELSIPKGQTVVYNSIRLSITGKERTRHRKDKIVDAERNLYFKELIVLAGEMNNQREEVGHTAMEGIYRYPFAYKLPLNIPASMSESFDKTDFAEVLYQAKAVVIKPRTETLSEADAKKAQKDAKKGIVTTKTPRAYKFSRFFHLIRPMPLNQYEDRKAVITETPFHLEACGCCNAGNQIQYLDIERTVVAIDRDTLQVVINVDNTASKKAVQGLQLKLRRTFIWRCNDYTKTVREETISKETFKVAIAAAAKGVLSGICPIPLNVVPSFRNFNMSCTYDLYIKVIMSGCKDQIQIHPITIVQSVDDSSTAPKLVYGENAYTNVYGKGVTDFAYKAPTKSTLLAFNPIVGDVPTGKPSESIGAEDFGPLALPSNVWQVAPEKKEQRKAHVNGEPLKQETIVFTGGLKQPQVADLAKSTSVNFRTRVVGTTIAPSTSGSINPNAPDTVVHTANNTTTTTTYAPAATTESSAFPPAE